MYYYSASPGTAHKYKLLINRCKNMWQVGISLETVQRSSTSNVYPYVTKTPLACQCLEFARLLSSRIWEQDISNRSFESCLLWRVNHVQGCSGRWHPHVWQDRDFPEFSYICASVSPPASTISITLSACIEGWLSSCRGQGRLWIRMHRGGTAHSLSFLSLSCFISLMSETEWTNHLAFDVCP